LPKNTIKRIEHANVNDGLERINRIVNEWHNGFGAMWRIEKEKINIAHNQQHAYQNRYGTQRERHVEHVLLNLTIYSLALAQLSHLALRLVFGVYGHELELFHGRASLAQIRFVLIHRNDVQRHAHDKCEKLIEKELRETH